MRSIFGRGDADELAEQRDLRLARIEMARRCSLWQEIPDDLVERAPGRFVSASSDAVYTRCRGVIFGTGNASIIADRLPVFFTVEGDKLECFEREPATWSEQLRQRELRKGRAGR